MSIIAGVPLYLGNPQRYGYSSGNGYYATPAIPLQYCGDISHAVQLEGAGETLCLARRQVRHDLGFLDYLHSYRDRLHFYNSKKARLLYENSLMLIMIP